MRRGLGFHRRKMSGVLPVPPTPTDPEFEYVTLLLPGNGTNGAQNNTFLDASTNNFTITRNGNTTQGTFTPYGANWSNYFDSVSNYLALPSGSLSIATSQDFTIEFWINRPSTAGVQYIILGAGGQYIDVYATGMELQPMTGGSGVAVSWSPNVWYHIAWVRQSNVLYAYVNGVQQSIPTPTSQTSSLFATTANIGAVSSGTPSAYISNLRVVKGTAVYTSNFTPSTTPLTAITNTALLTCQSNRFIDNSSNAFAITVTGSPSVQRFSPFSPSSAYSTSVVGGSGYFDGSGDSLQAVAGAVPAIGTGDFQISGWWYFNQLKNYQILFDFRNGTDSEAVPYIFVDVNGTATYYVNAVSRNFSTAFKAKEWTYVVVSRVGSTTKAFMNGAEVLSYTDTTTYVAGRLTLGFNNNGGPYNYYDGYIAGFRLVTGSGTTSTTVPTAPPTAITGTQALLNFTNAGIIDNAMMNDLETVGNAQISTTQSKFGGSSMYFDGTGDWLTMPSSENYKFGTGDFTIEAWIYSTSVAQYQTIIECRAANTASAYALFIEQTSGKPYWYDASGTQLASTGITINTWQHIAVARSGSTIKMFLDGTQVFSGTNSNSQNPTGVFYIGRNYANDAPFVGYIDDLRITKGYARYTANFSVPTTAFPTQ